jgi:hypothetical protein
MALPSEKRKIAPGAYLNQALTLSAVRARCANSSLHVKAHFAICHLEARILDAQPGSGVSTIIREKAFKSPMRAKKALLRIITA